MDRSYGVRVRVGACATVTACTCVVVDDSHHGIVCMHAWRPKSNKLCCDSEPQSMVSGVVLLTPN
jgi:hypothetical protein